MLITDLDYFTRRANYRSLQSGLDNPLKSNRSKEDWYAYPEQDFDYQFNSWGFRGNEYNQYVGEKVNLCLGDSFTVNLGGPIEHSWCSQLAKHFDIPTLNLGMDGAGNDAIKLVYNRACKIFNIQNTFVMYSYLHRRLCNNDFHGSIVKEDDENFQYFLQHRIIGAYESAIPYWNFTQEEEQFLRNKRLFFFGSIKDRKTFTDPKKYNNLKGADWLSYEKYVVGAEVNLEQFTESDLYYSNQKFKNRDGHHMNQETNKVYADYFYNQWKQLNES